MSLWRRLDKGAACAVALANHSAAFAVKCVRLRRKAAMWQLNRDNYSHFYTVTYKRPMPICVILQRGSVASILLCY